MRLNWIFSPINHFLASFRRQTWLDETGHNDHVDRLTADLIFESNETNQRTGMRLFCRLPGDAANRLVNHRIDPYYKEFSKKELRHWIEMHLFFNDEGKIIAVHDYGNILWKHPAFQLNNRRSK